MADRPARESVPFRLRPPTARPSSSPTRRRGRAADARRAGRARVAALVRAGQAAAQLHAPRDRLLRRGRADLGSPLGRRGDRHAPRGARLAADRERDPARVRAGVAVLLLVAPRATPTSAGCRRSSTSTTRCSRDNGVRVNYDRAARAGDRRVRLHQEPRHARGRRALVVHGGAIIHRYGLGSWQRGREVIWEQGARGAPGARST